MSTKLNEILENIKTELPNNLFMKFIESQREEDIYSDGNLNALKNKYDEILDYYIANEDHED